MKTLGVNNENHNHSLDPYLKQKTITWTTEENCRQIEEDEHIANNHVYTSSHYVSK